MFPNVRTREICIFFLRSDFLCWFISFLFAALNEVDKVKWDNTKNKKKIINVERMFIHMYLLYV